MGKFQRTYGYADFGITANKTAVAATWSTIGSLTVPAGQLVTFGANEATSLAGGSGAPCYMKIVDESGTVLDGTIRFSITNAQQTKEEVIAELRTEKLYADSSTYLDRSKAALIQEGGVFAAKPIYAQKDSKLLIKFYTDSATNVTIDYNGTGAKALIPVTIVQ